MRLVLAKGKKNVQLAHPRENKKKMTALAYIIPPLMKDAIKF